MRREHLDFVKEYLVVLFADNALAVFLELFRRRLLIKPVRLEVDRVVSGLDGQVVDLLPRYFDGLDSVTVSTTASTLFFFHIESDDPDNVADIP
jgi:hypothetical protein